MIKIKRSFYLDQLWKLIDTPVIKIITGIRGAGKSDLLESFYHELNNHKDFKNHNIVLFKLDAFENTNIKNANQLHKVLASKISNKSKNYLLLDEPQNIPEFDKVILDLYEKGNVDIYLTGSNSYMLSEEIATKFTRRNFKLHVSPFSFNELIEFHKVNNIEFKNDDLLFDYFTYGGLPQVWYFNDIDIRIKFLQLVYSEIIEKDLIPNKNIQDYDEFKKILEYSFQNIGQLFSIDTIDEYLHKIEKSNISKNTIKEYLQAMCDSLLINPIKRYNIIGKELLKYNTKYYASDLGIRNAVLGDPKQKQISRIIENIVYLELIKHGYDVKIGKILRNEIDFVATKSNKTVYIQVCESIDSKQKYNQEMLPLKSIKDSYPKYLITLNRYMISDDNGISIITIKDFLLHGFKD